VAPAGGGVKRPGFFRIQSLRVKRRLLQGFLAAVAALVLSGPAPAATQKTVLAVHFDAEVNPVTQGYVNRQIERAAEEGYDAVAIVLDTPGGLGESMRKIYQAELASKVPVIVWVGPNGARAGSAGVWIAEAADLLAMAPVSNIGSSTPIGPQGQDIEGALGRKVRNDAVASLTSLMRTHGRDATFARQAVIGAANLPADVALRRHVIDMVAPSLPALLKQADGYKTKPNGYVLHLAGAQIDEVEPGFFVRLLNVLIDPNIIFLLFLAGLAGIGYEIFHPGVVLPGALGAVALVTSLFGFFILPVTWAGVILMLLGIGLLIADAHVTSHGALTVAGLTSLSIGGIMLFNTAPPPYDVNVWLITAVAVALGGFWAFAITKAVQVRRRPASVGLQTIVGAVGEVRRGGLVFVNGELWHAEPSNGAELRPGDHVEIEAVDGLTLRVHPVA
jgi:membrane-bound serine protease (ClpP class)